VGQVKLEVRDASCCEATAQAEEIAEIARTAATHHFDLRTGPLVRLILVSRGPDRYTLVATMHHIVADGWSVGILFAELAAAYNAWRDGRPPSLPPLHIQYGDYAGWQRDH